MCDVGVCDCRGDVPLADLPRAEQLERLRARISAVPARGGADRYRGGESQLPGRTPDPGEVVTIDNAVGELLPRAGLVRGTVVCCTGSAAILTALLAGASQTGAHVAVVGMPRLGLLAYAEMGGVLDRLACVSLSAGADPVEVDGLLLGSPSA